MTIKVLHVYKTYYPDPTGGLQEAIRQISASTKFYGVDSTVFALSPNPYPTEVLRKEARVVREKCWAAPLSCDIGGIASFTQFKKLAKQADIVHFHYPWPFADLLQLGVQPSTPAVMTYHSDIVRQQLLDIFYSPLRSKLLAQMKAIVATSPAYVQSSQVLSHPAVAAKVRVIPLAIDETTYTLKGESSILRRLGIDINETFFLFVGVLRYYKGLHFLVEAAKSVNSKIVIAGSGPEGSNLKSLCEQMGVTNVVFAGRISDVEKAALLKRCRALVLPSHLRSEAYGMVLVEAAMSGKAMISCEINTGTSFVNLDGQTGIVVPPANVPAMAQALSQLADNHELAMKYGEEARKRYERLFSGSVMGHSYADLYRDVLNDI